MKKIHPAIIIPTITFFVFGLTSNWQLRQMVFYIFHFYVFFSIIGIVYYFWIRHHKLSSKTTPLVFYIVITTLLFWVGFTGWFYSPFFYLVYILAIILAFIFSVRSTFSFILTLSFLFIYFNPEIDLFTAFLILISFFIILPITYYLQRSYLILKQQQKKILILENEKIKKKDPISQFLKNKVDKLTVEIRQPVSDIKHLAKYSRKLKDKKKLNKNLKKIADLSNNIFFQINKFETKTTGKRLIKTKKS